MNSLADLRLSDQHVDIIRCKTEVTQETLQYFESLLSPEEVARVDRLRMPEKAREATVSRGLLRCVLGHVLNQDPRAVAFDIGNHGKPRIAGSSYGGVSFNLSHTRGMVLLALSLNCEVGVDVEWPREKMNVMELAERFFSVAERDGLRHLPESQHLAAFFRIWTRKEAIIKVTGRGIGMGLDGFSVPVHAFSGSVAVDALGKQWLLQSVAVEAPYVAAVATDLPRVVIQRDFRR